jgi:lipopolysaccharide biosynthesis glycosyltransferase
MVSILENANKNTFYAFYILVSLNFSKKYQNLINKLKYDYKCIIHFIFIKNLFVKTVRKISYITSTTYYRLLIGDILPEEFEKCIYLDIDICVCKDLSELFNINIGDNYIAGVVAPGYYFAEEKNCKRLNLSSMKQYVNAGMLIMNLKKIREDNMTEKFIELLKKNYIDRDQDVINVACYGKILTLPPKYNVLVQRIKENHPLLRNVYKEKDILEAKI